jgi:asparagine synthase (glutamine-hydrolysing)
MRDRLPREILQRPKRGFTNPLDGWLRRQLRGFVEKRLLGESPIHELLRREELRRLHDEHVQRKRDRRRQLFLMLTLDAWLRAYL